MLPFLPKRPFHLGGVSSCLLQWECPNVSIQVNQWYVNSYFLQSYPFKYPFFIPKIFIDLLNLGVLVFIQDFFCRDVFYLLIISSLPIFFFIIFYLQVLVARKFFWSPFQSSVTLKQHVWSTCALFPASLSVSQPFLPRMMRKVRWISATEVTAILYMQYIETS